MLRTVTMDIQVAVLCDAATDSFGKLNLLGAFDTIQAPHLPVVYPQCSIALRMTFNKIEEGPHRMRINFVDEDGKSVFKALDAERRPVSKPLEMPFAVQVPEDSIFVSRNFVVNVQNLTFEKPGLYSIDLAVDGRQEGSIPLLVKHVPLPEGKT